MGEGGLACEAQQWQQLVEAQGTVANGRKANIDVCNCERASSATAGGLPRPKAEEQGGWGCTTAQGPDETGLCAEDQSWRAVGDQRHVIRPHRQRQHAGLDVGDGEVERQLDCGVGGLLAGHLHGAGGGWGGWAEQEDWACCLVVGMEQSMGPRVGGSRAVGVAVGTRPAQSAASSREHLALHTWLVLALPPPQRPTK